MAKPEGEGLLSLAEAIELADQEVGEGTPTDSDTDDPSVEETPEQSDDQADDSQEEQPETEGETEALSDDTDGDDDESDEDESLFEGLVNEEDDGDDPKVDLESMTFDLPGVNETVSLQDLKDGFLRNADYTRKTQELADQRRALEQEQGEAKRIYDALRSDPMGFFSSLASQLGVEGVEAQGAKNPDFKLFDQDDFEAEVDKRVQERIENDPELAEARQKASVAEVNNAFTRIEEQIGRDIGDADRERVLRFAIDNEINSVEVAFDTLWARAQRQREKSKARTERAKKTSTKRSSGRVTEKTVSEPPASVKEAMERAAAEIAAG